MRNLPPIEKIARLDRATLAEIVFQRSDLRPQPVCYACAMPVPPLVPFNGKLLCPSDIELARMGRL